MTKDQPFAAGTALAMSEVTRVFPLLIPKVSSPFNPSAKELKTMNNRKKVLCPMDRQGKTYWMRIGNAFENVDGSTNVYLDAFPANGKLQIRDLDERDEPKRSAGDAPGNKAEALPF